MEALSELAARGVQPGVVVDIGTGSGILAVEAARLFPQAIVVATDVNPHAVLAALRRVKAEGLEGRVAVAECDGAGCVESFDLAVANLPYLPVDLEDDGCNGYLSMAWAAGGRGERALHLCREAARARGYAVVVYSSLTPGDVKGCMETRGFRVAFILSRRLFFEELYALVARRVQG